MLIVISSPESIENEASLINQLFDEGLGLFHLRKPDSSEDEIKNLMLNIDHNHYSKLVFHQHHYLAKNFGIKRLHYTELNRKQLIENDAHELKKQFFHLSTSIHSLEDYKNLLPCFDYTFLGPVFDSISKKDYKAIDVINEIKNDEKRITKLIAIGGITKSNLNEPVSWGFDGVAVLGSVWENENPINEFIQIKKACNLCEITS